MGKSAGNAIDISRREHHRKYDLMEVEAEGYPSKTLKEFEINEENWRQPQRITEDFVEEWLISKHGHGVEGCSLLGRRGRQFVAAQRQKKLKPRSVADHGAIVSEIADTAQRTYRFRQGKAQKFGLRKRTAGERKESNLYRESS
jgi:hypothetical protein